MKRSHLTVILMGFVVIVAAANHASAYYHAGMGRFLSRDPGVGAVSSAARAGQYRDGTNLYQYVQSAPTVGTDPSGLKCTVCSSGIRYRVSIPALDAHQTDQAYSKAADAWVGHHRTQGPVQTWHMTIPDFQSSGPVAIYNPEFVEPPTTLKAKTAGLALFLFFVDFEVCNPDDCSVELYETRKEQRWDAQTSAWIEQSPDAKERLAGSGPPWSETMRISERNHPLGQCTHTIVIADMPGANSILKPAFDGGLEPLIRRISANQRIVVKDKTTQASVAQVSHNF